MKRIIQIVSLAILIGWSIRINAATTEEYETQIKALASAINCMGENLAALVGEEQARQLKTACINPIPTNVVLGLVVTALAQPLPSLAPLGAARIPFTKVTFTASADGDVTVDGLVIERNGLSVDAVLDSIMLLDEAGMLIGSQGYLNANHQTTLAATFKVKAGQSRMLTIAANRPSWSNATHAGMVVSLSVVGVNTSATVSGSLPITGASHVINEGLVIGSIVMMRGSTDPGASMMQYVGTVNYTFSSIRIVAGSAENVSLKEIRWYQSGSATTIDLSNVKTYIDGVGYPTSISADGKYYTSSFGVAGIVIEKGFSKEIAIRGDIINGAARSIDFDVETRNDIYLVGQLYEFGIIPPFGSSSQAPDSAAFSVMDNPYYDAAQVTVNWGDITVSPSALVASQNIAVNMQQQMLGGFTTTVRGEPIFVRRIGFNVALENKGAATDVDDITNIVLVDENDAIVAGPVDGMGVDSWQTAGSADGSVIFTDTVTFPIGTHSYFIKGKLSADVRNDTSVMFSTTPGTDFALVRGLTTGHDVTPTPLSSIALQTMKAVGGSLTIGVPIIPENAARTTIAGARQTIGLTFRLYATASSEDVRTTNIPLLLQAGNGANATGISNVQLYDGTTIITTGSNVRNPTRDGVQLFTLDGNGFITRAGGVKTITLRFDVKSDAEGTMQWSIPSNLWESGMNSVGVATANAIPVTRVGDGVGPIITIVQLGQEARIQSFTVVGFPEGGVKFGTLRALGTPQGRYNLEASQDLKNWARKPWFPATADANGNILFEFEVLPQPREFFRVVSVP